MITKIFNLAVAGILMAGTTVGLSVAATREIKKDLEND